MHDYGDQQAQICSPGEPRLAAEGPRRVDGAYEFQRLVGVFFIALLFRASTDWMGPTHIMEGNIFN